MNQFEITLFDPNTLDLAESLGIDITRRKELADMVKSALTNLGPENVLSEEGIKIGKILKSMSSVSKSINETAYLSYVLCKSLEEFEKNLGGLLNLRGLLTKLNKSKAPDNPLPDINHKN